MRRGTCIHYRGSHQEQPCAAGVDYRTAFGPNDGIACRAPCLQEIKRHVKGEDGKLAPVWEPWPRNGQQEIPCDKRVMPTEEEIAAADAEFAQHMDRMRKVMTVVKPWRTWSRKNRVAKEGAIPCPTGCGGVLHLSQAAYNGHVWGKCETTGCVSWME